MNGILTLEREALAQEGELVLSLQASSSEFQGYFTIKVLCLLTKKYMGHSFESFPKILLDCLVVGVQILQIMVQ